MTTDATQATETVMVTKTIRITVSDQDWLDLPLRAAGMDTSVSAEASKASIEHLGHQQAKNSAKHAKRTQPASRVTIIASKAGAEQHPAWFHNLQAHPDVTFGGIPMHATVIGDE